MIIAPVLLAGGNGTRLSPLSQKTLPKQFLQIFNDKRSSFQLAAIRIRQAFRDENIFIATNAIYEDLVKSQLNEINEINYTIIAENEAKNTFPIIATAIKICKNADIMFFTPTDLVIEDVEGNIRQMQTACMYCYLNQKHILFGIKPTSVESNFGYIKIANPPIKIKRNKNIDKEQIYDDVFNKSLFHSVECFIEKPPLDTARIFCDSNNYYWNSGMFIFNREILLNSILNNYKSIFNNINIDDTKFAENAKTKQLDYLSTYVKTKTPHDIIQNIQKINVKYNKNVPEISIDNAIVHKITKDIKCVIADFQWLDFGNWKNFVSILFQNKITMQNNM